MSVNLTDYDFEVLRAMAGERTMPLWGAALSITLEFLAGTGFVTRGPNYQITDKGRKYLDDQKVPRNLNDEAPTNFQ